MAFLKKVLDILSDRRTITAPVFLKDFSSDNRQLNSLIDLLKSAPENKKEYIERDITLLKYGIEGEKNVYYELKNSFLPMICLHDIRVEYNDYSAQLDFVIITRKFIYILETKKLNGDIQVTENGEFNRIIRTRNGKFLKKEGMYSPITQNERHVNILRDMLVKEGLIKTLPIKSLVVISNPKSIIDLKENKELKNKIIKYDLLNIFLKKELEDKNNEKDLLEKYMFDIANFLIKNDKPIDFNLIDKYSIRLSDEELRKIFKEYRTNKSAEEGIKPYMVFTNDEMELLIKVRPTTKDDLMAIKGFGPKKVDKYGDDIISYF